MKFMYKEKYLFKKFFYEAKEIWKKILGKCLNDKKKKPPRAQTRELDIKNDVMPSDLTVGHFHFLIWK